jgi:hypothetical protein
MRRFPVLFWLPALAAVLGWTATPAATAAFELRPAAAASRDHALPTFSRVRGAAAILPSLERARPGGATLHAAMGSRPGPYLGGFATASLSAPAAPFGGPAARSYFPTGPPLFV